MDVCPEMNAEGTRPVCDDIEPSPYRPGAAEARVGGHGVPVWALVGHYLAIGQDAPQVAADYELPLEAVEAALAYYEQHKAAIDARLEANTGGGAGALAGAPD